MSDDKKLSIRKQAKRWRSVIKRIISSTLVLNSLLIVGLAGLVFWVVQAVYYVSVSPITPQYAIQSEGGKGAAQYQQQIRGIDGIEYLVLPSRDDPVVIPGNWDLPPITGPLRVPDKPMKRLKDNSNNYIGSGPRKHHGIIGKRPDGGVYDWVASLDVSLDREMPDYRRAECVDAPYYKPAISKNLPATSVVIIFSNEPWETLMRSVHSIFNNTPPHLLYEIILVDDGSTYEDYTIDGNQRLVNYMKDALPLKVKLTRTNTRAGITRARLQGILLAKADMFIVLDSHIETEPGWIEPLVYRTMEIPTTFVMPMIDSINKNQGWAPQNGGVGCSLGIIWKVTEHALHFEEGVSPPHRKLVDPWGYITSPSMSGGLFGGHRQVFLDLGGYDLGMSGWGAENVEFGMRLWQCGASLDCSECSRVGHVFGRGQFYKQKGGEAVVNRLRTAAVWMDEFSLLPLIYNHVENWDKVGDVSERLKIRDTLQCHPFKWFLDNVWPESDVRDMTTDIKKYGVIRNVKSNLCFKGRGQGQALLLGECTENFFFFSLPGRIMSGSNDESCAQISSDDTPEKDMLKMDWPYSWGTRDQKFDILESQAGLQIVFRKTKQCIAATQTEATQAGNFEMRPCETEDKEQLWIWDNFNVSEHLTFQNSQVLKLDEGFDIDI